MSVYRQSRIPDGFRLALLVLVGQPVLGTAQERPACVHEGRPFREAVLQVHRGQSNVGLAAAVTVRGQVVESLVAGHADLEHDVAVTERSRFGTASVTKAVTGAALLRLVQEGIVRLDDPVRNYVPEFPPSEPPLTIRHLVTHTSGLPHPQRERTPQLYATHYDDVLDAMEVFRDVRRVGNPGGVFRYSSSNYNLLAIVIQRAAGRKFEEYVRSTLFDPLDMSETAFDDVRHVMPNRTRRYAYLDPWTYRRSEELQRVPGRWDYSFNTGGGNVISTALDLVKFGNAFVTPGVFSRAALESVYRPISTGGPDSPWSYGWFAGEDHGRRRIHMTGANPGVQAGLVVYPDDEVVVAVLSNSWGHDARSAEMVNVRRFAAICMGWPDP